MKIGRYELYIYEGTRWKKKEDCIYMLKGKVELTAQQMKAAEILANADFFNLTFEDVAAECGCSPRALFNWRQNDTFIEYKNDIAERRMKDYLSDAYVHLRKIATSGANETSQLKAIELVLKNRGKLTENQRIEQVVSKELSAIEIEEEAKQLLSDLDIM